MKRRVNFILETLMVLFFAAMFYFALRWPPNVRFFPLIIAVAGLGLSISLLIMEIVKVGKGSIEIASGPDEKKTMKEADRASALVMSIWLFALFAVNLFFGFWVGGIIFMFFFMRIYGRENLRTMAGLVAALMLAIYVIISMVLKIPVYGGLLGLTPF